MKQIELNLQKRILIVEAPEGELTTIGKGDEFYYAIKNDENYIKIVDGKKWKLICKGDELTEEIAKGLVKPLWDYYYNYKEDHTQPVGNYQRLATKTALESFISAIESQGYYWGKNPVKNPEDFDNLPSSLSVYCNQENKHFEAE